MVVVTERGREALDLRPHDTEKRGFSMLNQPTTFGDPRLPVRFWDKVCVLDNGCWQWMSTDNGRGYGRFTVGSRRAHTIRSVRAHRWAYEHLVGSIPTRLEPDHLCRNRACVNPDHLELVTHRENLLRGNTIAALHARKTHCPSGHPYDAINTYIRPNGWRACRACHRQKGT